MTPLDRAFVKAFQQRDPAGTVPPPSARSVPLAEALGNDVGRRRSVPLAMADAHLLEAFNRAPSAPKAKPSGCVPAPHFALRRPEHTPPAEPEAQLAPQPEPERDLPAELAEFAEPAPMLDTPPEPEPECAAAPVVEQAPLRPAFAPGLQVEHFDWPKLCKGLEAAAEPELERLTDWLAGRWRVSGKAIGVCAGLRGEGATTVLLCLARRLALSGVKTIAVDLDLARPQLSPMLGLAVESGWEAVPPGRQSLGEVVIHSIDDRLAVLPLGADSAGAPPALGTMGDSLDTLGQHYEMVLLNLGPLCDPRVIEDLSDPRLAERIGPLLVVSDARNSRGLLEQLCAKASAAGIHEIVVVENFVASEALVP